MHIRYFSIERVDLVWGGNLGILLEHDDFLSTTRNFMMTSCALVDVHHGA